MRSFLEIMIISNSKYTIILVFCALGMPVLLQSQDSYEIGLLPKINLSTKLSEDYNLNFKIERRDSYKQGFSDGSTNNSYDHELMDYGATFVRNVGLKNRIGLGLLFRFHNGDWQHRITQQFIFNSLTKLKLSHRFVLDQTFSGTSETYRMRYRASISKALNGDVLDSGETYLKLSSEWLNIFRSDDYEGEFRLLPTLGYVLSDHSKIELGLDYRVGGLFNATLEQSYYLAFNWYYSF